jgi:PhnB protein
MKGKVKPIPEGYAAPTPSLIIQGAAAAIDFYKKAFGAKEIMRMPGPNGKVGHADLAIGGGHIMLGDEFPDMGNRSPKALGGSPVTVVLYVEDVDAVVKRAVAAGAKILRPVENQFWGDRAGQVADPFGHIWYILTHIEDVSNEEMEKRAGALAESAKV